MNTDAINVKSHQRFLLIKSQIPHLIPEKT